MRKTLFTGLAGLSLLICIATIVLWVRSYRVSDMLQHRDKHLYVYVLSVCGRIDLYGASVIPMDFVPPPTDTPILWTRGEAGLPGPSPWFFYQHDKGDLSILIPHGLFVMLTAILPILWLIKSRRRFSPGMCQKCGYDLRASTERCPECGTPIAPLTPSPAGSQSRQGDRGSG